MLRELIEVGHQRVLELAPERVSAGDDLQRMCGGFGFDGGGGGRSQRDLKKWEWRVNLDEFVIVGLRDWAFEFRPNFGFFFFAFLF